MHQKEKLIEVVEIDEAIIGLRSDGIIHVYYKDNIELNIELQERTLSIYNKLAGPFKRGFIFEAGDYVTISKEARENAKILEKEFPSIGLVVFVSNLAYRLIAEFYYKFNKPHHPYKVVTDFEKGINWLKSIEVKEESPQIKTQNN